MTVLTAGGWRLALRPELGGAVGRLSWRGSDVLRSTPEDADDPLRAACFPLVPYANRIDHGRFVFEGREVALPPTPGFAPHALHGDGWRRPWSVVEAGAASATLELIHPAGDWPWAWSSRQRFDLTGDGLTITLSLTNEDAAPMPAGMGLHPYFVTTPGARLTLAASGVWTVDGTLIPVGLAAPSAVFDWSDGARVDAAPFVDNAYAGWDRHARLADRDRVVTVEASANAGWAHVYAPVGEGFVCVEPVTQRPNALNAPVGGDAGLTVLAPGETLSMTMTISAA